MLLALLFFLLCLAVGAVALTAASANAGRTARLARERQEALAVESALDLLRTRITAMTFTGSYRDTVVYTDGIQTASDRSYGAGSLSDDKLSGLLESALGAMYRGGGEAAEFPITLTLEEHADYPAVTGSLKLEPGYLLTLRLESADGSNAVSLAFSARAADSFLNGYAQSAGEKPDGAAFVTETYTTDCTTAVTWTALAAEKGAAS